MAAIVVASVAGGGDKSSRNAIRAFPTGPRVQKNAFGYYIAIDEQNKEWLDVKGFVKPFTPEAGIRRGMLPPDAQPVQDKYSKELHTHKYYSDTFGTWQQETVDEYGRSAGGKGSNPLAALAGIAQLALPYIPGIGTAGAAGLAAAMALGQGRSLKDAALASARATVPAHLQFAYDIGVGVASGESIDSSALAAAEKQYPGATQYYNLGKELTS